MERAYGLANRALGVATTVDTQFAIASGSKGLTALAVMSLVERGELGLETTARSLLGADLSLIDDEVTVEHLLAHRAGIGDYLDEDEVADNNDYVLTVPLHELTTTEQFLAVLDGHPMKYRPDELPGRAAVGYLHDEGLRSNVFHLPVRGNGDGGMYTTAADVHALWDAMFAGRVVSLDTVAEMVRQRSEVPELSMGYGLGFWLDDSAGAVSLLGGDAGVGFVSTHHRGRRFTFTVLCNQTRGAWPVSQRLNQLLAPST